MNSFQQARVASAKLHQEEHILGPWARELLLNGRTSSTKPNASLETVLRKSLLPWPYRHPLYDFLARNQDSEGRLDYNLLLNHTPLGLYRHFLPETVRKASLIETPLTSEGQRSIYHTSSWRWCEECARNDVTEFGYPLWRIRHQLPAIKYCSRHGTPLASACRRCNHQNPGIQKLLTPPLDSICENCRASTLIEDKPQSDHSNWYHKTTLDLVDGSIRLQPIASIRDAIRGQLGVGKIEKCNSLEFRRDTKHVEDMFWRMVDVDLIHEFFVRPKAIQDKTVRVKTINIRQICFRRDYYPSPVVFLVVMKTLFGGIERFVQRD